ncbi:MAG: hypothetical protein R3Y29_00400 [bacterium]
MAELEEALRAKMNEKYGSIRSFAKFTGVSYEKIVYCLNRSIDSSNLGSIKKICEVLDLNLNLLAKGKIVHNYEINDNDINELIELYIKFDEEERDEMRMQLKYLELKHNKKNGLK